jgi:hypothetical protein
MFRGLAKIVAALPPGNTLLCVLMLALPLLSTPVASGAETSKKVLILSSEDQSLPAIKILSQAIRSTLMNGSSVRVQFYNEAQDNFRILHVSRAWLNHHRR